jgi:CheY-like chemotaxis protein
VADDNPFEELHLAAWLKQAGFRVTVAKDGIQALELTQRFVFEAVVCDSLLSGLDGFELCLAIRRDPLLANLPVVLSPVGEAEPSDLNVARRVGARAVVVRRPESAGEWPESLCAILDRDAPATLDDHRHRQSLSGSSRN